jgi:hypothetical protein
MDFCHDVYRRELVDAEKIIYIYIWIYKERFDFTSLITFELKAS